MPKHCKNHLFYTLGSFFFILTLILSLIWPVYAEINPETVLKKRAELEAELSLFEKQIEEYRSVIKEKQKYATTFERDIAILNAKIQKSLLAIKARKLAISQLSEDISEHSTTIQDLALKINSKKTSLGEFVRRVNELDETSLVELILKYDNFSDFFVELDTYDTIQKTMRESLQEIKEAKTATEEEKGKLEKRKVQETDLKIIQELEKKRIEENKNEKNNILQVTKGEEQKYQKLVLEKQRQAAQIRARLFLLRGSPAIPFEKALRYANAASIATGVRPALLLGVLAEESELGANLGSGNWRNDLYECYKKIGYIKASEKQKEAFMQITQELGLDPDSMPVSKAPGYGCGGAMGPAQFMPTTWQLYKNMISEATGHKPPNPWDALDAFMAAALLLKDNGATRKDQNAEWKAALRYFAGSNWNNPSYKFYGDDVIYLANKYQNQIDILNEE